MQSKVPTTGACCGTLMGALLSMVHPTLRQEHHSCGPNACAKGANVAHWHCTNLWPPWCCCATNSAHWVVAGTGQWCALLLPHQGPPPTAAPLQPSSLLLPVPCIAAKLLQVMAWVLVCRGQPMHNMPPHLCAPPTTSFCCPPPLVVWCGGACQIVWPHGGPSSQSLSSRWLHNWQFTIVGSVMNSCSHCMGFAWVILHAFLWHPQWSCALWHCTQKCTVVFRSFFPLLARLGLLFGILLLFVALALLGAAVGRFARNSIVSTSEGSTDALQQEQTSSDYETLGKDHGLEWLVFVLFRWCGKLRYEMAVLENVTYTGSWCGVHFQDFLFLFGRCFHLARQHITLNSFWSQS